MELEIIREFRQTSQNTFEHVNINNLHHVEEMAAIEGHNRKIRPTIYKTFLKVKSLDSDTKVCTASFLWKFHFFFFLLIA